MKKILGLFVALSFFSASFAVGTSTVLPSKKSPKLNATEVFIPIGKSGQKISLMELAHIRVKEVEALTGEKMKFTDKVSFKLAQSQLAKSINPDGTINSKKLNKFAAKANDGSGFHLGGFALGFLLGLIGVLIAYLIKDDKKPQRVKWAWLGLAAWVVIWLLLFVIL
jgi:hypothetical protein